MKLTVGQLIGIVIIIAIVGVGAYFGADKFRSSSSGNKTRQAVFLTNGQVYFGYVKGQGTKNITMREIYYLQVQQPLQQSTDKKTEQPQVSLVKLGNELHGPTDEMRINRDHVLFIEDMKDDSKVNAAIADFIKNGGATPTPSPAAQ